MREKDKDCRQAHERISEIAQKWFLLEPFLFQMYCTHRLEPNGRMEIPVRSGQGRIEFNPTLINEIDNFELADRLKAEALRIALKHPYQRQPFRARPEILYLASNMTIYDNMDKKNPFRFDIVPEEILSRMPKGKTFEEYYGLLSRAFPQEQEERPSSNNSENNSIERAWDYQNVIAPENSNQNIRDTSGQSQPSKNLKQISHIQQGLSQSLSNLFQTYKEGSGLWEEDTVMTVDLNLIIQNMESSKGWGSLPGRFIESIKASLVPPMNVANVLKGFKKSILSQKRSLTRMRPSRRYGFEQMGSKYAYDTNILVALDVSGSVGSEMLSKMLGLVNRIFKQGVENIDIIQFDSELKGAPINIRKAINHFKISGRGGTDFQPAADYYIEHPQYDGLIYITDGEAPTPDIPSQYIHLPVTWLIINDDITPSILHGWHRK